MIDVNLNPWKPALRAGVAACLVIGLSGCTGGGGGGSWSFTMGRAAYTWPPARIAAHSRPAHGNLSAIAGGLLDLLLNAQTAYAAVGGGTFNTTISSDGSFSGSYSAAGPAGCTLSETVSGTFSGTSVTFTVSGSGCGATISGSGSGTADVAWPNATSASGTYTVTVTGGICKGCSGSWSGKAPGKEL